MAQNEAAPENNPMSSTNPFACSDEERTRRLTAAREARSKAIPKHEYARSIQNLCLECWGTNPAIRDCEIVECELYVVNTRSKRRGVTKKALKRAIKAECISCVATTTDLCCSPNCQLYRFRFGKEKNGKDTPATGT